MNLLEYIPTVIEYLSQADLGSIPGWQGGKALHVRPLAQGEYNLNYRLQQGQQQWVLRVNTGTQIGRADQIRYEFQALQLLESSGVTPRPYYLDDSHQRIPLGVLVMEYLPGEPLDYGRDLEMAAALFAKIHTLAVDPQQNSLIHERQPLSMTYTECKSMLSVYLESELAEPKVCAYLRQVMSWADEARLQEYYFLSDPWYCIINTEVNSGNFIANREQRTLKLVDWEKPLWGDPSQDLSHFYAPTTTLWKTRTCLSAQQRRLFLDAYRAHIPDRHLRDTIVERVRLRDPFNCLRGICWSAMAWVRYQTGEHVLCNEDTLRTIRCYLRLAFLHELFEPYLH